MSELVPTVCQGLLAEFIEHNNPRPAYLSRRVQVLGALVAQPIRDGVVAELLEYNDHWLQQGIVMSGGARVGQPPHIYRAWPAAASPLVGHEEFNRGTEQHRTVIWQPRMPRS